MDLPRSATALAAAVRAGQVSPRQAVSASLERIAAGDGRVHAFRSLRAGAALAEADELAARDDLAGLPLAGVPLAVKDFLPVAGLPTVAGSLATDPAPAPAHHELVTRLRAAGGIVVGTTTSPEAALWPTTDVPGRVTRNPWDRRLSPGGSSGGSAAAVAAGMVPLAHGDDALGSIRIPAAACGLVGVKPGRDVVTPYGPSPATWFGLSEQGVLASTVDDAALMLSVLAARPDLATPPVMPPGLRVGVTVAAPVSGIPVDPEIVRLTFQVAEALRRAGASIQRRRVRYPRSLAVATLARWFAVAVPPVETAATPAALQRRTLVHARVGRAVRALVRDSDAEAWRRRAAGVFDTVDVLLAPVLATGVLPAETWSQRSWTTNVVATLRCSGGFTGAWNLAGLPAVAVPAGRHPLTGMPTGVQLVGPPGSEPLLLGVAAALERHRPWPLRAPDFP